jgi:hypothetical protein
MEAITKRFSASQEYDQQFNFYPPNDTCDSLPRAADDHATPADVIIMDLSYSSYQTLPLAQDLTTCFLRDQLFSCDGAADKTPRHHDSSNHAGRDITTTSKRLEKNGELQPFPYDAGHSMNTTTRKRDGTKSTAALEPVPPSAMEAITRKFSASQEHEEQESSYSFTTDYLFDLPGSNFSPQFCSFANNTHTTSPSPVIPWGDTIVDKKQDTPQQEQNHQHEDSQHHQQILFSRDVDTSTSRNNADTAPSNDNASLDADITSIIAPNKYRELVTGFTYAVMCQFVRAKIDPN